MGFCNNILNDFTKPSLIASELWELFLPHAGLIGMWMMMTERSRNLRSRTERQKLYPTGPLSLKTRALITKPPRLPTEVDSIFTPRSSPPYGQCFHHSWNSTVLPDQTPTTLATLIYSVIVCWRKLHSISIFRCFNFGGRRLFYVSTQAHFQALFLLVSLSLLSSGFV